MEKYLGPGLDKLSLSQQKVLGFVCYGLGWAESFQFLCLQANGKLRKATGNKRTQTCFPMGWSAEGPGAEVADPDLNRRDESLPNL